MRAIIIATGQWKRLLPLTENKPVSLLAINNRPLIEHQINNLLDSGIDEVIIIAGKFYGAYKQFVSKKVKLVRNPFYEFTNVNASIWLLKDFLNKPFILVYDDVYFSKNIIKQLESFNGGDLILGVTKETRSIEAEKVFYDKKRVVKAGKFKSTLENYAEFIGVALFKGTSLNHLINFIENIISNNPKSRFTELIETYIEEGFSVKSCDIQESIWADIDTPEDYYDFNHLMEKRVENGIVYVTMCADPLHYGHINLIKQAKKYGEKVIVGLLTDEAITEYKNPPLIPYELRKIVVESIKYVDQVIPQETGLDYTKKLKEIKPRYLVHGDDWIHGKLKETRKKAIETMKQWSGEVIDAQYTEGICSTDLKKII